MENVLSARKGNRLDARKTDWTVVAFWCLVAAGAAVMVALCPVFAAGEEEGTTFWSEIQSAISEIYTQFLGISTVVAAVAACIALLMRMLSRNQQVVEQSTQWLKRILIAWVIMNSLGFIVSYLGDFTFVGGENTKLPTTIN